VCDSGNNRVFVANHIVTNLTGQNPGATLTITWQYGMIATPGNATNQLNAPYSALMIGDYTGLPTPSALTFPTSSPSPAPGPAPAPAPNPTPQAPSGPNTFQVTLQVKTTSNPFYGQGYGSCFAINGNPSTNITLQTGVTYTFQMNNIPSTHVFYIGTSSTGQGAGKLSGVIQNQMLTYTPTTAGTFYYQCENHAFMGAAITVNAGSSSTSTSTSTTTSASRNPNPFSFGLTVIAFTALVAFM